MCNIGISSPEYPPEYPHLYRNILKYYLIVQNVVLPVLLYLEVTIQ